MDYGDNFASPNIQVNGFVFCKNHGDEWCDRCCYDHRMTNNIRVEDDLPELNSSMAFDIDDRDSFNVYGCGAVHDRRDKSYQYQCRKHDKIDCKTCFDWARFIRQQGKEAVDEKKWLNRRRDYLDTREG